MTPREIIAHAISKTDTDDDWTWLGMADAVIDALEGMRATEAMERVHDEMGCLSTTEVWQAMVGAMRDEL